MKALTFHAPEIIRFEDAPEPVLVGPRDAIAQLVVLI